MHLPESRERLLRSIISECMNLQAIDSNYFIKRKGNLSKSGSAVETQIICFKWMCSKSHMGNASLHSCFKIVLRNDGRWKTALVRVDLYNIHI